MPLRDLKSEVHSVAHALPNSEKRRTAGTSLRVRTGDRAVSVAAALTAMSVPALTQNNVAFLSKGSIGTEGSPRPSGWEQRALWAHPDGSAHNRSPGVLLRSQSLPPESRERTGRGRSDVSHFHHM